MSLGPVRMALAGGESAGVRALRQLLSDANVSLAAVFAGSGNGRGVALAGTAAARELPVWPARMLSDPKTADLLRDQRVDVLLNVHSLVLVDEQVLEAPTVGCFNLHPGPLPRYAGLNSPCWAVHRQEQEFGVTLHRMTAVVDAGPIVVQSTFEVGPRETGLSLTSKTVSEGANVLTEFLAQLAESPSRLPAREQDLSRREYLGAGPPYGGRLPWHLPAAQLDAFTRACDFGPFESPWGHPLAYLEGQPMAVRSARAAEDSAGDHPPGTVMAVAEDGATVTSGDGLLIVQELELDGQVCTASEVLRAGQRFDLE